MVKCEAEVFSRKHNIWCRCSRNACYRIETYENNESRQIECCKQHKSKCTLDLTMGYNSIINVYKCDFDVEIETLHMNKQYFGPNTLKEHLLERQEYLENELCLIGMYELNDDQIDQFVLKRYNAYDIELHNVCVELEQI